MEADSQDYLLAKDSKWGEEGTKVITAYIDYHLEWITYLNSKNFFCSLL